MRRRREHIGQGRRVAAVAVSLTLLLTAGCAGTSPAGQAVPELRGALSRVDGAIVDDQPGQARRQLRQLIHTTVQARDAGRLDSTQANAVLAAAASLLSTLPRPRPEPTPPPAPAPKPEKHEDHKSDEEHKDHGHGHAYGHQDETNGNQDGESDEDD